MNDAENLVPALPIHDENALPQVSKSQSRTRRPPGQLGKPSQKLGKSQPRRRALGDITNSSRQQLQPSKPKLRTPQENKLQIWRDEDDVPEPEIIPPAPPTRPFEPAPLFSNRELADMRRELEEEEEDNDATDDFGRPFMTPDPVPIPPPPYSRDEDHDHDIVRRGELSQANDYFSPAQMFPKDDLPVLELA